LHLTSRNTPAPHGNPSAARLRKAASDLRTRSAASVFQRPAARRLADERAPRTADPSARLGTRCRSPAKDGVHQPPASSPPQGTSACTPTAEASRSRGPEGRSGTATLTSDPRVSSPADRTAPTATSDRLHTGHTPVR